MEETTLESTLLHLGLSENEIKVYVATFSRSFLSASEIAKKVFLPRTTVYNVLGALGKKGLVESIIKKRTKYFTSLDPKNLITFLDLKTKELAKNKKDLENLLPDLVSLYNPHVSRPKLYFYEGMKGMFKTIDDTLSTTDEIIGYSSIDSWFLHPQAKKYIIEYGKKRVLEKKIKGRFIVPQTPANEKYITEYPGFPGPLTQVKYTPYESSLFRNELNIYGNRVMIAALDELFGVIIESKSIADTQRGIFNLLWRTLP